jgi:hypothetical protein
MVDRSIGFASQEETLGIILCLFVMAFGGIGWVCTEVYPIPLFFLNIIS